MYQIKIYILCSIIIIVGFDILKIMKTNKTIK